jgi:hypothetical protein
MIRAVLAAVLSLLVLDAQAKVLYDGSSAPSSQGWSGPVLLTPTLDPAGFVTLDTTPVSFVQDGFTRIEPLLKSSPGFRLDFTVRVDAESHVSDNRAGFSVIVTDGSKHGVEIGFWQQSIWAQQPGFLHDAQHEAAFDTGAMTPYSLTVLGGHYTLAAGGKTLIAGDTVFYDAPGLLGGDFPYRTPHVLFFGDDTTSAAARFSLQRVVVTSVPEPSAALFSAALLMLAGLWIQRRPR